MLSVKCFPLGPLQVNTYLIYDLDTKDGILIDPGDYLDEIYNFVKENNINIKYIINTHEHTDHTAFNKEAKRLFPEAKLCMHPLAAQESPKWINSDFGKSLNAQGFVNPDVLLSDGDKIFIGNHFFEIIYAPGHSLGSICLFDKDANLIVVGDLIFKDSIGRYDLPGSNFEDLRNSIKKLSKILDNNTKILPGHGPFTTWGREKKFNPYIIEILSDET